jgi:hypothetical protein
MGIAGIGLAAALNRHFLLVPDWMRESYHTL